MCLWLIVPLTGSFVSCLIASSLSPRRTTISPVYVTLFTVVPAILLGGYVTYENYSMYPHSFRTDQVTSFVFSTVIVYMFLAIFASLLHRVIRGLVGAFAEKANILSGMIFYQTSVPVGNILMKIEDKKWLSDLCAMHIVEKKEDEKSVRLKLNKHETNFYLSVYLMKADSGASLGLIPYEMKENLAEKRIVATDDSRLSLSPQMKEMVEAFKLNQIPADSSPILNDSVIYAMSPARFPMISRFRYQFSVITIASVLSILFAFVYHVTLITVEVLVGVFAIIVAITSTIINLLSKK